MRLKNGHTPLEAARMQAATAIYHEASMNIDSLVDDYGLTPVQAREVKRHLVAIHNDLLDKWELDGTPL